MNDHIYLFVQLITGISYISIASEYIHWKRSFPFRSFAVLSLLFIGFTFFCGAHHLAEVVMMMHAPHWAFLWFVNVPMAIFSVITAILLRANREYILIFLDLVETDLRRLNAIRRTEGE